MPENHYHRFFELFATPLRIEIIKQLKLKGSMNVTQICHALGEEQSKVSHNLKRLLLCNIVRVNQMGNFRYYELNKDKILPLLQLIDKHVQTWCKECQLERRKKGYG